VAFQVRFAGMDRNFRNGKPTGEMAKAEKLVIQAIGNLVVDLLETPKVTYEWGGNISEKQAKKEAATKRSQAQMARARLKEAFRELGKKPLNIFIATDLTVAEKMSLTPLALQTAQVYISPAEYGDTSKLQAAIRIPLVALLGGEVGLAPGGQHGMQVKSTKALTGEQTKEALLHETIHTFLINRGASSGQVWDAVGPTMVKGSQTAKEACEKVMWRYLRAQEEVFVYTQVGELYSAFSKNKLSYEAFIAAVDLFLASISANPDQTKTIKLRVGEKVDRKKVDWLISFKYPRSITVSEAQLDKLKELAKFDIGT